MAKLARLDAFAQLLVRCAYDAHVHRVFLGRPDLAHFLLLYRPQQLDLHGKRQIGDFVQKQRAAAGGLEKSVAFGVGARKGAFLVAEELGFHQVFGNGTAIDGHERLGAPRPLLVDQAGS